MKWLILALAFTGCMKHPGWHYCGTVYQTHIYADGAKCPKIEKVQKHTDKFIRTVNKARVKKFTGERFPKIGPEELPKEVIYTYGPPKFPKEDTKKLKHGIIIKGYHFKDKVYLWRGWGDKFTLKHEYGHSVGNKTGWWPNDVCHESIMWAYYDPQRKRGTGGYKKCKGGRR